MDIYSEDHHRFFVNKPDPSFNEAKARNTIAETIRKTDARRLQKRKDANEALDERSSAVASYLNNIANGSDKSVEAYFGRRELARLQGQKILQKLKNVNGKKVITFEQI